MTKIYEVKWEECAYVYADDEDQAWSKVWDGLREAKKAGCYVRYTAKDQAKEYDHFGKGADSVERCVVCGDPVGATLTLDGFPVYEGKPYCETCLGDLLKDELANGIVARKYYPSYCTGFPKYTYVVKDKADLERQTPPLREGEIYVRVGNAIFYYLSKAEGREEWWGGAYILRGDQAKIDAFLNEFPSLESVWSRKEEGKE